MKLLDILGLFYSLSERYEKMHISFLKNLGLVEGRARTAILLHLKLKTTLDFFESLDRSNMLVALGSTFLPLFSVNPVKA